MANNRLFKTVGVKEFKVNKPEFKSIDTNRCCYDVTQYFIEKRQTITAIKKQIT